MTTSKPGAWLTATLIGALLLTSCSTQNNVSEPPTDQPAESVDTPANRAHSAKVMRRDFKIAYVLEGATASSKFVPLTPPAGTGWSNLKPAGTQIAAGDAVGKLVVDEDYRKDLAISAETSRIDAARLSALAQYPTTFRAPIAGTLNLTDAGDPEIESAGIDVVVPITGIQQLRLSSLSIEATTSIETVAGQRTVACAHLWTGPATDTEHEQPAELRCRLPRVVETAAGLRATVQVTSAVIKDATVVPETMLGQDEEGYTVTLDDAGEQRTVPVDVGPGDGVVRTITSELPIGAALVAPRNE